MRKVWTAITAFLLLSSTCVLAAQTPDPHSASPRTSPVVQKSTFLHGYLHGYEEGYSAGDMDLQMARTARDPDKLKESRPNCYRSEFGIRRVFDTGYREGFRVGYADSFAGRAFRAVNLIQQVMTQSVDPVAAAESKLEPVIPPQPRVPQVSALLDEVAALGFGPRRQAKAAPAPRPSSASQPQSAAGHQARPFDQGFADGYSSGQRRGVADARGAVPFATPTAACPAGMAKGASFPDSCIGYVRGFAMGYTDGYVNVAHIATSAPATSASAAQSK